MSNPDETMVAAIHAMGVDARGAATELARASAAQKTRALHAAADAVAGAAADILSVNEGDVQAGAEKGLSNAFIDRMTLNRPRLDAIIETLHVIAEQDDPIGDVIEEWTRPNGLRIKRVRSPIGVIGVVYESRPNVTVDAAAICLKSGNAVILRSGSDCLGTAKVLHRAFLAGVTAAGLPVAASQLIETPNRAAVGALLAGAGGTLDLLIPRGGKSLVARVQKEARAPVLSHLDGVCHVYIDGDADPQKAVDITVNAKMRRTGVCGAAETVLIDRAIAQSMLPTVTDALRLAGCEIRACDGARQWDPLLLAATSEDWYAEYLDAIIALRIVDGVWGAIDHIARYGSGHTETILTENARAARDFMEQVDSAIVMHNASTQFADGGEFGLGAEIGIATGKLHARGPVGARELTSYRNLVYGTNHTRPA